MDRNLELLIKNIQRSIKNYYINSGGCIHFAYFLSKELNSRNIKHTIYCGNSYFHRIKISEKRLLKDGCSHVFLKIDNIYFDSVDFSKNIKDIMSPYSIITFNQNDIDLNDLRNKNIWNHTYNKSYNSVLSRIINKQFKIYDNSRR